MRYSTMRLRADQFVLVVALSAGVVGCSGDFLVKEFEATVADKPVAYRAGFSDGCSTGIQDASVTWRTERRRDEDRMRKDLEYSLGWSDGARQCSLPFGGGFPMVIQPKR